MLKQFYEKALPREGYYCVAYNNRDDDRFPHQYATSIEELVELIESYREHQRNVFVAMGSFSEKKREASKAIYVKSFYIDLDVGESKEYQTQKEAVIALSKFLEDTKLPLPAIVNSGNGIHAYWFLKEQLPITEWKTLAVQLKQLCIQKELKIDLAITADSARLLRCPDTNNYKQSPPKPTLIIRDAPEYNLKEITDVFNNMEVPLEEIVKKLPLSEDKKLKYANFENHFKPLLVDSINESENGCGQIKYYIDNVKTAEEPLWWRVLSLANNCVDRDEVIHVISKDHPGYNFEETERKASGAPKTCKDFNLTSPGICEGCRHWDKISTPIQLHRYPAKLNQPLEHIEAPIEGEHLPKVRKESGELPATLEDKGYWIGAKVGGIYKSVTVKDKKGVTYTDDKLIYEYTMRADRHVRSSADGNCLIINVWHPHDGLQEFILPMKALYEKAELRKMLTSHGIYYETMEQEDLIMKYFIDWAKDMQKKNKYDVMYDQMGWNEDKTSFVIGSLELGKDGTEKSTPISSYAKAVAPFLSQSGTFEGWQKAAQKLNQHGLEMHMFTMLCGFGSILMDFSSTTGVAISLTGESGAAKTGALYGALSIWGTPKDLSVMNTTANALQQRFLTLHNLPLGFDEVGNKNPYLLSDFILAVSQGKAKLKQQASTNAEREYEAPASLIAIMTSNHSIYDKLKTIRSNPNGEAARLIEFPVRKPKAFIEDARLGKEIFDEFNSHYGWAGTKFVKAVFDYGTEEDIKLNLSKWENRFVKDFGNDTAYRFYENLVAVTMTAGEIVDAAGILSIDIERIYKFVVGEMIQIRDDVVKVNNVDYESVLSNYLNANYDKILAFQDGKIISEPMRQLTVRVDNDKDYMYISKREFDSYLAELPISTKEFVYQLQLVGVDIKAGNDVKQRMNAGWKDVQKSATAVYRIKLSTLASSFEIKPHAVAQ
jgi:hypothetical protein